MNLLIEELDLADDPKISFLRQLGEQWQALLPRILARIVLENENQAAIAKVGAANLLSYELDSFSSSISSS